MEWTQFFSLLVPIIALFGFLYKELKEWKRETTEEIRQHAIKSDQITAGIREEIQQQAVRSDQITSGIREEIQQQMIRSDQIIVEIRKDIQQQAARSDRLYEMFIDLLREHKATKSNP